MPFIGVSTTFAASHNVNDDPNLLSVDLNAYCVRHNPNYDASFTYTGDNAYKGVCLLGNGSSTPVDVGQACADQYGATAEDRLTSFIPPIWNCFKDMSYQGVITPALMEQYAHLRFDRTKTFQAVLVNTYPAAYGWRIKFLDGSLHPIDLHDLCNYMYYTGYAMDRVRDVYDPNSWTCWSR